MIKLIKGTLRGKLNRRGIALPEIFFAFLILITVTTLVVNFFMPRTGTIVSVDSMESDYEATLLASASAIEASVPEMTGSIDLFHLTGYLPVINYSKPSTLYLLNILDGNNMFTDYGMQFDIISRYRYGSAKGVLNSDDLIDLRETDLTVTKYSSSAMKVSNVGIIPAYSKEESQDCYANNIACPSANYYITISKNNIPKFNESSETRGIMNPISEGMAELIEHKRTY